MTKPRPDEAILRNFTAGKLGPADMALVVEWMNENPEAADELSWIQVHDRITDALDGTAHSLTQDTSVLPAAPVTQLRESPPLAAPGPLAAAAAIPAVLGGFTILRELGRGGMGVVLESLDPNLGRKVALKVILPAFAADTGIRDRFLQEAKVIARITHDNVVPIHQVGEDQGLPFLVMPLLAGETLADRLARVGKLSVAKVKRIGRDVAAGLAAAHAVGVVHRDIKPGNIWLDAGTDRARILDFGLAKPLEREDPNAPMTRDGTVMGTPFYMAPEQAQGVSVDRRADLFSLGVVLYHAATGERPFKGETAFEIIIAVTNHKPTPADTLNSELPPNLADMIAQLLQKRAADRPESAESVATALDQPDTPVPLATAVAPEPEPVWGGLSETEVIVAPAAPVRPRPKKPMLSWARFAVAVGLLLTLGIGAAVYQFEFKTKEGALVVEVSGDADVRFKNGELQVFGADGKLKYTLKASERNAKLPAGQYTVRVVGADGVALDTPAFTMSKDGTVVLHVTAKPDKLPPPVGPDSDRVAAEAVLKTGGTVGFNGTGFATTVTDLPKEPFRLTRVVWHKKPNVTDANLEALKNCKHITGLSLTEVNVTDAGAAIFKGCKNLTDLCLQGTRVTDDGHANFKDCTELRGLNLRTLYGLQRATDRGVANFRNNKKLTHLDLGYNAITDTGVGYFKDCAELETLYLTGCERITDASLVQMANYPALRLLDLLGTPVTDTGIQHLKGCPSLTALNLVGTKVTEAGALDLAKALPGCRIAWGGVVIEPTAPDRGAAQFVIENRGTVRVNGTAREIKTCADLPLDGFRLTGVNLKGIKHIDDKALERFKGCKHLTHLDLSETAVSAAGLKHLKDCTGLKVLVLANCTKVTDDAMPQMKEFPKLTVLVLLAAPITDVGAEHLKACRKLTTLWVNTPEVTAGKVVQLQQVLPRCQIVWDGGVKEPTVPDTDRAAAEYVLSVGGQIGVVGADGVVANAGDLPKGPFKLSVILLRNCKTVTDTGLAACRDCTDLVFLDLHDTPTGDAGLAHFKNCLDLQRLYLERTKVTDAGLAPFKNCANLEMLFLTGTAVTDAGLANFRNCTNLIALGLQDTPTTDEGLDAFTGCAALQMVYLNGTKVTAAGLAEIKGSADLRFLALDAAQLSDASLAQLRTYKRLGQVDVHNAKDAAKTAADLRKALPLCKIVWDGKEVEPKAK